MKFVDLQILGLLLICKVENERLWRNAHLSDAHDFFFATEASNPYFLSWLWSKPKYSTLALLFPPLIKRQPPRTKSIRISPRQLFSFPPHHDPACRTTQQPTWDSQHGYVRTYCIQSSTTFQGDMLREAVTTISSSSSTTIGGDSCGHATDMW